MKKERMTILKMINDGKITVDEAIKLMESIKSAKAMDTGDVIESVKEKVSEIVEDAKPVVKKYAAKAKEVGEEVYNKGKAKVEEYKTRAKNSDFADEIIIDPAGEAMEAAEETAGAVIEKIAEAVDTAHETIEGNNDNTIKASNNENE
ncbi:MAG: hypothetical protein Q4D26_02860 [Clostridia bacterium]|nr:hypothetical protein [Clostridia bacterium]